MNSTREIIILGVGMTPLGEHWDLSIRELALEAISAARAEAPQVRPEAFYVANMLAPALSRQSQLGALLADFVGLRGIEAMTVEAAGASGGAALRQAYLALKSGMIQSVLVVGAEKVTDRVGSEVDAALATMTDTDYEAIQGITPTAQAALLMRRYLHEYHAPQDALAGFSLNAHANGASNPLAMFQKAIRPEQYSKAPMVSDPINMFDASPIVDGAAAILLACRDTIPANHDHPLVKIAASAMSSTAVALHDQPDPLVISSAVSSVQKAFEQAKLSLEDIDLFELHDSFSIMAALSLEAAGFASKGEGWKLAADGAIALDGKIPICTFGGSKARGEAGGATGVMQVVEVVRQLQALAGKNQVSNAKIGMAQCLGGIGATAVTHILTHFKDH
ncbi:MAG: acetyl-CoA acetyltransferase [Chloroflexi bacterium RBG_16_48_8]|nr:MAG: acetyl-CoA acetyltransferase [Chloroflexi bacterium RBG_16_48_8]